MEGSAAALGAFGEAVIFLNYCNGIPDHRQQAKVVYPMDEVLLLCLIAVLAGAETFVDIARFGDKKLMFLRRFRPFLAGTPAHDHLGDIFASLDAQAFQRCFVAWVASLTGVAGDVIAIDGKTLRRSGNKKKDAAGPIHMVSAFAARQRLVLGQVKVDQKSNEITAIPKLLEMLAIEGAIITIDAMGWKPRDRKDHHGQESRLRSGAERQPGQPLRGCRTVRRRAEGSALQAYENQPESNS